MNSTQTVNGPIVLGRRRLGALIAGVAIASATVSGLVVAGLLEAGLDSAQPSVELDRAAAAIDAASPQDVSAPGRDAWPDPVVFPATPQELPATYPNALVLPATPQELPATYPNPPFLAVTGRLPEGH